jgi:hypothetical protein
VITPVRVFLNAGVFILGDVFSEPPNLALETWRDGKINRELEKKRKEGKDDSIFGSRKR